MGIAILKLRENRVRRMYMGGAGIEKIHGRKPVDSEYPEEWIGSVVEAHNSEMTPVYREGISKAFIDGDCKYLDEIIKKEPQYYLGKAHYEMLGIQTGVLVKYLDSAMRLALQAHPDRAYARLHLDSSWGKMECYYILDIRENTEPYIYLGFQHAPEREEWKRMVECQDLEAMWKCFEKVKVHQGEFWYIPSGLVHAIGEGITMIEIMEPSDWVIRCEFERIKGKPFPYETRYMGKSIDEVMEVFDFNEYTVEEVRKRACVAPEIITDNGKMKRWCMISSEKTDCFSVEIMEIYENHSFVKADRLAIIVVIEGCGQLSCNQIKVEVKRGGSFFLAASACHFDVDVISREPLKLCMVMPKKYGEQDKIKETNTNC